MSENDVIKVMMKSLLWSYNTVCAITALGRLCGSMGEVNQGEDWHRGGTQVSARMPRTCDFVKSFFPCWEAERLETFHSREKGRLQCSFKRVRHVGHSETSF